MGSGHVVNGYGVARQLQSLGLEPPVTMLPWEASDDCARLVAGYADAVFGVDPPPPPPAPPRVRLGVTLEAAPAGARIASVTEGSVAAKAKLRVGDVIVEAGGSKVTTPGQLAEAIARQAPGSWLPIRVERGRRTVTRVAKFPPATSG
jgi:S1-C subfamily serine protease